MIRKYLLEKLRSNDKSLIISLFRETYKDKSKNLDYEEFYSEIRSLKLYNKFKISEIKDIYNKIVRNYPLYMNQQDYEVITHRSFKLKVLEEKRLELVNKRVNNELIFEKTKAIECYSYEEEIEKRRYNNTMNKSKDTLIKRNMRKANIRSIVVSQRQFKLLKKLLKPYKANKPISIISYRVLKQEEKILDKGYYALTRTKRLYETNKAIELTRKAIDKNFYCKETLNCNKAKYTHIKVKGNKIKEIKTNKDYNCNYCIYLKSLKNQYITKINKSIQLYYEITTNKDITIHSFLKQIELKEEKKENIGDKTFIVYLRKNRLFNLKTLNYDNSKLSLSERIRLSNLRTLEYKDTIKSLTTLKPLRKYDLRYLKPYKIDNISSCGFNWNKEDKTVKNSDLNIKIEYFKYLNTRKDYKKFNSNVFQLCNIGISKEKANRQRIKAKSIKTRYIDLLTDYCKTMNKSIFLNSELGFNRLRKTNFDANNNEVNDIIVYNRTKQDKNQLKRFVNNLSKSIEEITMNLEQLKTDNAITRNLNNIEILTYRFNKFTKILNQCTRTVIIESIRKFRIFNDLQLNNFNQYFLKFMENQDRRNMSKVLRDQFNSLYTFEHSNNNYSKLAIKLLEYNELTKYCKKVYSMCIFNKIKRFLI